MSYKDDFLLEKWKEFSDIPFDDTHPEIDMVMDEDWWMWKKGTDREVIWKFFDENYTHGLYSLLYHGGKPVENFE